MAFFSIGRPPNYRRSKDHPKIPLRCVSGGGGCTSACGGGGGIGTLPHFIE
jgi:hypothetical protein